MRVLRWEGRRCLAVREMDLPPRAHDEVLVRVAFCGICGSDLEEYLDGPLMLPVSRHPVSQRQIPIVLGHEISGVVVKAPEASALRTGDRVCLESLRSCGNCEYCRSGQEFLCDRGICIGLQDDGGMAEFVTAPVWACHQLPDSLDPRVGALVEPLSVVVHAWKKVHHVVPRTVGIFGAGTIGLGLTRWTALQGASPFVIEPDARRRALSREFGAVQAMSPETEGLERRASSLNVIFECSGHEGALDQALSLVKKGGIVVAIGVHRSAVRLHMNTAITKEIQLVGSVGNSHEDFVQSLRWVSQDGALLSRLIGGVFPLERAIAEGFDRTGPNTPTGPKLLIHLESD